MFTGLDLKSSILSDNISINPSSSEIDDARATEQKKESLYYLLLNVS